MTINEVTTHEVFTVLLFENMLRKMEEIRLRMETTAFLPVRLPGG